MSDVRLYTALITATSSSTSLVMVDTKTASRCKSCPAVKGEEIFRIAGNAAVLDKRDAMRNCYQEEK